MKTIGEILKEKRLSKKYSLEKLEKLTKIKKEFIDAIEKSEWEKLPEYATVYGFIKSLSGFFCFDEVKAIALLRRDYPPKRKEQVGPKPDVIQKLSWSPQLTFWAGFLLTFVSVISYLVFQYNKFVRPPTLNVIRPEENQVVTNNFIDVLGKTDNQAVVTVNNQLVLIEENGEFQVSLQITRETSEILVKAVSRSGKETVIHRNIKPEF